jgi:hypothetical protein
LRAALPTILRHLPDGVGEAGLAMEGETLWLWAHPSEEEAHTVLPQLLLDLPAGRYQLDFFDARERRWFARESATAPPLVVALPRQGAGLAIRIRLLEASIGDDATA